METVRKVLNTTFLIVVFVGLITLTILLIGGAFPININPSGQNVKFDITHWGWEVMDPSNGEIKITFEKQKPNNNVKQGWGALEYTYKVEKGSDINPGIVSESYSMEGLTGVNFWIKAKKPGKWRFQIQRKSDNRAFYRTFSVGKEWKNIAFGVYDLKLENKYKGKFTTTDFKPLIKIMAVPPYRYDNNTVWIDNIEIRR